MTLSELIEEVGNENVEFQNLMQGDLDLKRRKRDGEITFYTGLDKVDDLMSGGDKWLGLVVWLPKDKLPENLK